MAKENESIQLNTDSSAIQNKTDTIKKKNKCGESIEIERFGINQVNSPNKIKFKHFETEEDLKGSRSGSLVVNETNEDKKKKTKKLNLKPNLNSITEGPFFKSTEISDIKNMNIKDNFECIRKKYLYIY